jgi:hypothetical protein
MKKIKPNNLKNLSFKQKVEIMERFRGSHAYENTRPFTKTQLVKQFNASNISVKKFLINTGKKTISDSLFEFKGSKMIVSENTDKLSGKFNTKTGGLDLVSKVEGKHVKIAASSIKRSIAGQYLDDMKKSHIKIDKLKSTGKIDPMTHKALLNLGEAKAKIKADARQLAKTRRDNIAKQLMQDDDAIFDPFDLSQIDSQAFADMVNDKEYYAKHKAELNQESRTRNIIKQNANRARQEASRPIGSKAPVYRPRSATIKKRL